MTKLNNRNKWSLSIGCVGRDMCYTLVSLFLLTYLQYTGMFNTQQFVVLSIIIVICRIWDAVNDPMMGTIITNTKSKFGKYRPWVLIGAISNAIVMVLMFSVRFTGWAGVVFIGIMYLLWGMTFTMNDISYWDLLPALASEKKERDSLTTFVAVFASLGAFLSGGLVPLFSAGNMVAFYRTYSIISACCFLACQLLVFFNVHDNKDDTFIEKSPLMEEIKQEDKVNLKGMVHILFSNKQLLVMAIVILLYSLGSAILNAFGQNFFYFKFGYLGDNGTGMSGGTMMLIFTVIYAIGTLASEAIYPMLAKKYNRQTLITVSIIALAIGYILFFVFANTLSGMVGFILICTVGLFIFTGQGIFYLIMLIMLTNTIEYDELNSGTNHAAITFTVRPFMVKLAGAIQYGVVAITLIVCGLYTITSDVGDVEALIGMLKEGTKTLQDASTFLANVGVNSVATSVDEVIVELQTYANGLFISSASPLQMVGLTTMMCLLPIVLFVIAYFVIKKKYIITEEVYEDILRKLQERKEKENLAK